MELSKRFRRPKWTDARLLVGAALVVVAITATYLLINAATATTRVWVSAGSLVPGQVLEADDLVVAEVNLADIGDRYLSSEFEIPVGSSVRSVVAAGELVPASMLVPITELAGRIVAIDIAGSVPTAVDTGSLVDVWASAAAASTGMEGTSDEPEQIVAAAPVAHIDREVGSFGAGNGARIEVFVPSQELSGLLSRLDGNSVLSVVTVPGAAPGVSAGETADRDEGAEGGR